MDEVNYLDTEEEKMTITCKCPKCGQQLHAVRINLMLVGIGCANSNCTFHAVIEDQTPKQTQAA
jgi:ssDNA-binding Zn-finger/Zn-ribbon topoisomerase 1